MKSKLVEKTLKICSWIYDVWEKEEEKKTQHSCLFAWEWVKIESNLKSMWPLQLMKSKVILPKSTSMNHHYWNILWETWIWSSESMET